MLVTLPVLGSFSKIDSSIPSVVITNLVGANHWHMRTTSCEQRQRVKKTRRRSSVIASHGYPSPKMGGEDSRINVAKPLLVQRIEASYKPLFTHLTGNSTKWLALTIKQPVKNATKNPVAWRYEKSSRERAEMGSVCCCFFFRDGGGGLALDEAAGFAVPFMIVFLRG